MKRIRGFEGYYITRDGNVFSEKYGKRKKLKPHIGKRGYRVVHLSNGGVVHTKYIYRLVLENFVSECPSGMEALHGKRGKLCDSIQNLRWGTRQENQIDRRRDGTDNGGERCAASKLKEYQVEEIRKLLGVISRKHLARNYGVSTATITDIAIKRTWNSI